MDDMPAHHPADTARSQLRGRLRDAMSARDRQTVSALRSAIGAIDNAEAVAIDPAANAGAIEQAASTNEAARRELSAGQVIAVLQAEVDERRTAATEYDDVKRPEHAERLRGEADAIASALAAYSS